MFFPGTCGQWVKEIERYGSEPQQLVKVLVGNRCDNTADRAVDCSSGKRSDHLMLMLGEGRGEGGGRGRGFAFAKTILLLIAH